MIRNVALFDVDYTIIKGDSMFSLLWYGIKKKPSLILKTPLIAATLVGFAIKLVPLNKAKEMIYYPIKYLSEDDLRDFFENTLVPKMYPTAKENLAKHRKSGDFILLVTASPYAYMKFFKEFGYADDVLGTQLEYNDGVYVNKIVGDNCKGEEKVKRIQRCLFKHDVEIDFEESTGYSDSSSDIPMLKLVKNRFKVNKKTGTLTKFIFE